jgi:hypothetical protein
MFTWTEFLHPERLAKALTIGKIVEEVSASIQSSPYSRQALTG